MVLLDADGWEYDEVDVDALRRCVAKMLASREPGKREQIEDLLTSEPWIKTAKFCAYCCQQRALGLAPWQSPPAWGVSDDPEGNALLDRMLEAGVSQWDPDPIAALAEAERKAKLEPVEEKDD